LVQETITCKFVKGMIAVCHKGCSKIWR